MGPLSGSNPSAKSLCLNIGTPDLAGPDSPSANANDYSSDFFVVHSPPTHRFALARPG